MGTGRDKAVESVRTKVNELIMELRVKRAVCLCVMCLVFRAVTGMEHKFKYYTDNSGLSSNTIQCLYQDEKGYIWVGTADGLDRFNSCDFTNYRSDHRRAHTLENNCVYSLCAEGFPNGDRIWVGTSDGVYIFDSKDESFVNLPILSDGEVRHNLLVYSLAADVAGNMWIGTLGDGLYRYNIRSGTFEHYTAARYPEAFSSDVIVKVLLDHDNNVWVASGGGSLLSRYNPENNRFSTFRVEDTLTREPISRISTMCQDSFGDIWIAGYACELYKFELSRLTFTCNKPDDGESYGRVRSMIEYSPGVMMLGTDHGLVNFNAKYRSFEQVDNGTTNRNGRLNDKFIHSILKDRDGGIWIGTYFGGINYLSPLSSLFTLIEAGEGCGRIISKFCEGPGGNIWIGSDDGGLSLYNPRTGEYRHVVIDAHNPALNIHALTVDGCWLWVGTYGDGLYRVDLRSRRVRHFSQHGTGLDNLDVYSLYRDSRGQLWIGTKMGICRYDDVTETVSCAVSLGHNSDVVDICEDTQGHLWFASLGKGLIRYGFDEDKFTSFSHDPRYGLTDFVSCLAVEGGVLWIGTHGTGLCRYDIAADTLTREFDALPYGNCAVFQIIQNGSELWLTTNRGLLKYNRENGQQSIYKFTSDDGLLANIFNANSGIKSSTGHIYIGCNNGIDRFYPYDFTRRENSAKLNIVFRDFKLFNRSVPVDGGLLTHTIDCQRSIRLRGRKISFSLDFIALNFSSPLRTVYRYRLENFDDKWITTGQDESAGMQHVSYTNLPPNRYRFVVSASTGGEQFGEEAVVEITVLPPWWMTRAMIAVYGVLFVASITGGALLLRRRVGRAHREQIASITRKNKLDLLEAKVNLFTEVANEIRTPVALIAAPVEEIAKHAGVYGELREDVDIVRKNCERLRVLVNQILSLKSSGTSENSLPLVETVDVREVLAASVDAARDAVARGEVKINLSLPGEPITAGIYSDYFSKITGHILNNACKFARSRIDVTLEAPGGELPDDVFRVRVRDDGAGISREEQARIFDLFYTSGTGSAGSSGLGLGLAVAKNLAARMGARLGVESVVGEWSEFTVTVPLNPAPEPGKAAAEAPAAPRPDAVAQPDAQKRLPNILLVEANADFADFFVRHLADRYTIRCVADGRQALDMLRRRSVSAVVSAVALKGMDGIALCAAVRNDQTLDHLPVILVSVDASSATKVRALQAGADAYLEKPLSVDYLDSQIRTLVEMRRRLRLKFSKMPYSLFDEEEPAPAGDRFMAQVNQYIMDNISNSNLSVEDVAAAVGVSRTLFFSRIKSLTGTTPNEFLRSTRLKVAAELLSKPNNLRVTEICYMVGFTSTSYFAKCFHAQFGMLPNEFLEKYRRE